MIGTELESWSCLSLKCDLCELFQVIIENQSVVVSVDIVTVHHNEISVWDPLGLIFMDGE